MNLRGRGTVKGRGVVTDEEGTPKSEGTGRRVHRRLTRVSPRPPSWPLGHTETRSTVWADLESKGSTLYPGQGYGTTGGVS